MPEIVANGLSGVATLSKRVVGEVWASSKNEGMNIIDNDNPLVPLVRLT
jgi:hypothetical protein